MKISAQIILTTFCCIGIISCGKEVKVRNKAGFKTDQAIKFNKPPLANHEVKPIYLGVAESFAAMAYSSISAPFAINIKGKIGLKNGSRSMINIDSTKVEGGPGNIYSADDVDEKAIYLILARNELIKAYREAALRPADPEKDEQFGGNISDKILPPGVYKWSNGVRISSNVTLQGLKSDVWIFQINGDVSLASNANIKLGGSAQAKNVFWQISGNVTLDNNSKAVGTMMGQGDFEMKEASILIGRALVKNGNLVIKQSTIELPLNF